MDEDLCEIKDETEKDGAVDITFVRVEQNNSDLISNFYDENEHVRDSIGDSIKKEAVSDFKAVVKTENVANKTKVKAEITESEDHKGGINIGMLKSEELEIIDDPDINTISSIKAETSVLHGQINKKHQRPQRNLKKDADIYKDADCDYQPSKKARPRKYKKHLVRLKVMYVTLVSNHSVRKFNWANIF